MWNTWRDFKAGRWVWVKSLTIWIFTIKWSYTWPTKKGLLLLLALAFWQWPFCSWCDSRGRKIKAASSACCICDPLLYSWTSADISNNFCACEKWSLFGHSDIFRETKTFDFFIFFRWTGLFFFPFFLKKYIYKNVYSQESLLSWGF